MTKFIAVAGKGGVGKTTLTSLILKHLVGKAKQGILAVDADPNANLNEALGLTVSLTISQLIEDTKNPKAIPPGMSKDVFVQYKLQEALAEGEKLDLIVMGNPQGPGCYCYANDLLRKYLENLTDSYELVLVDTEAGLEHISRKIIPRLDVLLVVADASARAIRSARRIKEIVQTLNINIEKIGLIVTKAPPQGIEDLTKEIELTGLPLLGAIPFDQNVADYDLKGKPLFELPFDSSSTKAVGEILEQIEL